MVSRLHALPVELVPGGISNEISVSKAVAFLADITAATAVEQIRLNLADDFVDDIRRLDAQLQESHTRIGAAVRAWSTTVTDRFGVGPMTAAVLIGNTSDIRRLGNRDHFDAAEFNSGN